MKQEQLDIFIHLIYFYLRKYIVLQRQLTSN